MENENESPSKTPIEYEQVSIQVPKQIMELLRFAEKTGNGTPKDYIETSVLQTVRGDIDADALLSNENLIDQFQLRTIYKELLGSY